ncbi:hypothetical protein ABZ714_08975 [Streptomyces sp. NPDC006798]|uniref:hypothetical protein n=1 Tax=Streptomyces sp. NPDC006798 TaxID=3155462 RepID=UPI0033EAA2B6
MRSMREGFGPGMFWNKVSKTDCGRIARDADLPLWLRAYFAAQWRLNQIGHAEFQSGELAEILADENGKRPSDGSVANAVARAKDKGLIKGESNARCLMLSHHHARTGKGAISCSQHNARVWRS